VDPNSSRALPVYLGARLSRRAVLRVACVLASSLFFVSCSPARTSSTAVSPTIPNPTIPTPTIIPTDPLVAVVAPSPTEAPPGAGATVVASPTALPTTEVTLSATPDTTPSPRRLVGYLASWTIGKEYQVADVPANRLTHLNYAFAGISPSGECVLGNARVDGPSLSELRRLKQRNSTLRTSISITGGGATGRFPTVAGTADARQHFAQSCVRFIQQYGLDGVDLDWEYPTGSADRDNLTLLLAELRSRLDQQGIGDHTHYFLTIAAPASPAHYLNFDLGKIHEYVDWLNLMTYAFHGGWDTTTNFEAPLHATSSDPSSTIQRLFYNGDAVVQAYLAAGVPASKIVVGVPFYGRGWKGVPDVNHGLYQPADGVPPGTHAAGIFAYRDLKDRFLGSYSRYWHDEAQAPWLYNPSTGVMITYDDPESLGNKADYAVAKRLGGIMIWELSTDDVQHSLVEAIFSHLRA
jgi:chitinase